ncbi:MAG: serine hydrolase, partial [Gemmatimonadaceae bacterium]
PHCLAMLKSAAILLVAALPIGAAGDGLPVRPPESVGMSAERLATIDRVMTNGIAAGGFPGAAVVVGRRGAAVWQRGFGHLDWTLGGSAVDPVRTMYDVASLTKVVATTMAIMILYDEGKLRLDDPVSRYIPAFTGGGREQVTVAHLLTHRSGLPAGRDLWRVTRNARDARRSVISTPLAVTPGQRSIYSDLGADVLGFVAEAVAREPLDTFLARRVYGPLGMRSTMFRPAATQRGRIAPTEVAPPRGYPLRGEVHDENAYALGGVAGHAGLFSTAADLGVFAQMIVNGGEYRGLRIVSDATVRVFTTRTAGWRALGWDTCAGGGSCGQHMSERAVGHTGYTGTSLWIDVDREMFVVLLTNEVHATRAYDAVAVLSDVRADLADVAALSVMDGASDPGAMPAVFRADRQIGWRRTVTAGM